MLGVDSDGLVAPSGLLDRPSDLSQLGVNAVVGSGPKYFCNVPVSSFYLEMRCAEHVKTQTTYVHVWDVWQVLNKLNNHQLAGMNDPMGATGRIYACSSESSKTDALSKLNTATTRARKALDTYRDGKVDEAFRYLDLLFGGEFPAR